jgi:D-glutamate cyclase
MTTDTLTAIRHLIQQDPGRRGLGTDPTSNLLTACAEDFAGACRSLANTRNPAVAIVTGFFIPTANPPCGETDGPLGALFLARALVPLGVRVALLTDGFCRPALDAGLRACGLENSVAALTLPGPECPWDTFLAKGWQPYLRETFRPTHLIAIERVGPSHTPLSIQHQLGVGEPLLDFLNEVPKDHHNRCHTMRGLDITGRMSPAHLLFEAASQEKGLTTIGIGDGGNEIGMGKISWDVIRRNIRGGALVACRIPTDFLIVAGVSNWGAYGLAAGFMVLRGCPLLRELFDPEREHSLLEIMVQHGPLVDGVKGQQTATVDGLSFEQYAAPLERLADCELGIKSPAPPP